MRNKTYGFKDLIEAFINRRVYTDVYTKMKNRETVRQYYDGLYKELSRQLKVDLESAHKHSQRMFEEGISGLYAGFYFEYFIQKFIAQFYEIPQLLEAGGLTELKKRFNWQILKVESDLEKAYWQVFEDLFQLIFGKVDKVVTSQMLFDAGFDDTLPPVDDFF